MTKKWAPDLVTQLSIGRRLAGRFELRSRLGAGSTGAVFAAYDHDCAREVAVRVFLPGIFPDEKAWEALVQQVQRASRMNHPGLVRTFDAHVDGDLHFVSMELIEGGTLRQRMNALRTSGRVFSISEVVRLAVEICDAISYLHRHGIHGGVEPDNILLSSDGHAKLVDTETTRLIETHRGTAGAAPIRAFPYLAPERLNNTGEPDHRADQYATAVIAYEMLTGEIPVGRVRSARHLRPQTPRSLSRAVDRALEPVPSRRFSDMAALGAALARPPSSSFKRAAMWSSMLVILSAVAAGITFPQWRYGSGIPVPRARRNQEAATTAEAERGQAVVAASNWRRLAGLLPEGRRPVEAAQAEALVAEGDRRLDAMEYDEASHLFKEARRLYEQEAASVRAALQETPTHLATAAQKLRENLASLDARLDERMAEAAARVAECDKALRTTQPESERAVLEARRVNAEAERVVLQHLVVLAQRTGVPVGQGDQAESEAPSRQTVEETISRAERLVNEGRLEEAISSLDEATSQLATLTAWLDQAERALQEQIQVSRQIDAFASTLGPLAREIADLAGAKAERLQAAKAQVAQGAAELQRGHSEEAIALYQSARQTVSELRTKLLAEVVSRAHRCDAEGKPSAAISALDDALALDPDNATARDLRGKLLAHRVTNSIGMDFVLVPPGTFMMGSPVEELGRDEDEARHVVEVPSAFFVSTTEVTQAQWLTVMEDNPSRWVDDGRPVERVTWHDAAEFCDRLNAVAAGQVHAPSGAPLRIRRYRLPTEAEWEYACRAGTTTPFSFGATISTDQANYDGTYAYADGPTGVFRGETLPVASFPPNPWGLYDMHGNVWEWCSDTYQMSDTLLDRRGFTADTVEGRVLRGGSWRHRPEFCRSANRVGGLPDDRLDVVGFRVVLETE